MAHKYPNPDADSHEWNDYSKSSIGSELVEEAKMMALISAAPQHKFQGRSDRWCEICNLPDRHPVHSSYELPDSITGIPGVSAQILNPPRTFGVHRFLGTPQAYWYTLSTDAIYETPHYRVAYAMAAQLNQRCGTDDWQACEFGVFGEALSLTS